MPTYKYPVDIPVVAYSTTSEYRHHLRNIFNMNPDNFPETARDMEIDDESRDEFAYDEIASGKAMDTVYSATQDNALFQNIYKLAAGKMLSEDPTIGLTILFCYDYLDIFHSCLVEFFNRDGKFDETNEYYKEIVARLT